MKKVLVTGADGFIGSHLTESLLEKGYDVKAFVYYNSFNNWGWLDTLPKEKLDQIEIFAGDVRDPNGVRTAMKGVDQVFHLAALIAIPFSYHSPDSYVDTNIKGTLNVLQAARDLGTEKIMVTSTSEVYGDPLVHPQTEDYWGHVNPLGLRSCYDEGKRCAESLFMSYYREHGIPVKIVRIFNTYGPKMDINDGRVVSNFIVQAQGVLHIRGNQDHRARMTLGDFRYQRGARCAREFTQLALVARFDRQGITIVFRHGYVRVSWGYTNSIGAYH